MRRVINLVVLAAALACGGHSASAQWIDAGGWWLNTETLEMRAEPMTVYTATNRTSLFANTPTMAGVGPYFGCIVDVRDVSGMPADYLIYCSPDHANPSDGIYLRVCGTGDGTSDPTDPADWSDYGAHYTANSSAWDTYGVTATAYAIITGTFAGVSDTGETPHVVRVGSTWVMTAHSKSLGDGVGGEAQSTWRATSTNGIDWTYDSIVLDYDPEVDLGRGHTGYFRWGANPGIDQPYDYIGYSLHGGASSGLWSAMWGTDNPATGSWTKIAVIGDIGENAWGVPSGKTLVFSAIDPASMVELPTGEWAAIAMLVATTAIGANNSSSELALITLAQDGHTLTREPEVFMTFGGSGADDEEEVQHPMSIPHPDGTANKRLMVYQGGKDTNADDGIDLNTIMVADLAIDTAASLPDPILRPNHDVYDYDLGGGSAPSGISEISSTGGSIIWQTGYVQNSFTNSTGYAGLMVDTPTINPATDWFEVELWDYDAASASGDAGPVARIGFSDGTGLTEPPNGFEIACFSSIDGDNDHRSRARKFVSSSSTEEFFRQWPLASDTYEHSSLRDLAISYDATTRVMDFKAGQITDGSLHAVNTITFASAAPSVTGKITWASNKWAMRMSRMVVRKGTTGAGVAPTFTAAAGPGYVDVTLNKDCIGLSGFTLQEDDGGYSNVTTTAERINATSIRLRSTALSGGETVRVRYEGSGDVRSVADLVEVQTANGDGLTFKASDSRRSRGRSRIAK